MNVCSVCCRTDLAAREALPRRSAFARTSSIAIAFGYVPFCCRIVSDSVVSSDLMIASNLAKRLPKHYFLADRQTRALLAGRLQPGKNLIGYPTRRATSPTTPDQQPHSTAPWSRCSDLPVITGSELTMTSVFFLVFFFFRSTTPSALVIFYFHRARCHQIDDLKTSTTHTLDPARTRASS